MNKKLKALVLSVLAALVVVGVGVAARTKAVLPPAVAVVPASEDGFPALICVQAPEALMTCYVLQVSRDGGKTWENVKHYDGTWVEFCPSSSIRSYCFNDDEGLSFRLYVATKAHQGK